MELEEWVFKNKSEIRNPGYRASKFEPQGSTDSIARNYRAGNIRDRFPWQHFQRTTTTSHQIYKEKTISRMCIKTTFTLTPTRALISLVSYVEEFDKLWTFCPPQQHPVSKFEKTTEIVVES